MQSSGQEVHFILSVDIRFAQTKWHTKIILRTSQLALELPDAESARGVPSDQQHLHCICVYQCSRLKAGEWQLA